MSMSQCLNMVYPAIGLTAGPSTVQNGPTASRPWISVYTKWPAKAAVGACVPGALRRKSRRSRVPRTHRSASLRKKPRVLERAEVVHPRTYFIPTARAVFPNFESGQDCIGLRRVLPSNLNGPAAADRLWCADVAPYVSIHRCRSVAAVGRRDGGFDSQAAGAGLAWLRLPAGLSAAAQQQPFHFTPRKMRCGGWRAANDAHWYS